MEKNCKNCHKIIPPKPHANNVVFCGTPCREKYHYWKGGGKEWQERDNRKKAKKPDPAKMQCQICGLWYRQVGTHIRMAHKIKARHYREEYGFDVKRGQTRGWFRRMKSEQVFENNTVTNLIKGEKYRFIKGGKGIGTYQRSPQTLERLRKHIKNISLRGGEKI